MANFIYATETKFTQEETDKLVEENREHIEQQLRILRKVSSELRAMGIRLFSRCCQGVTLRGEDVSVHEVSIDEDESECLVTLEANNVDGRAARVKIDRWGDVIES